MEDVRAAFLILHAVNLSRRRRRSYNVRNLPEKPWRARPHSEVCPI